MRAAAALVMVAAVTAALLLTGTLVRALGDHALDSYAQPATLVALRDGRTINIRCTGNGAPTVVLEAGFQAWSFAWDRVQPAVAKLTRVCSYDRAGLGLSPPATGARDATTLARELSSALRAAHVGGPLVMVGHSAGGMVVRQFANLYPRRVVGMVLVDPSVEGQFDGAERAVAATVARYDDCAVRAARGELPSAEAPRCNPPERGNPGAFDRQVAALMATPGYWTTLAREYDAIANANSVQLRAGRQDYGAMPLAVLTAGGKTPPEGDAVTALAMWSGAHAAIAARSTRGVQTLVSGSGHLMMNDKPEVVVGAIERVVMAVRAKVPATAL